MKAIDKLIRAGYTAQQLAAGIRVSSTCIGMYRRGDRFPGRKPFLCIVEMAEARGLTLLARDFIVGDAPCEEEGPFGPAPAEGGGNG